MIHSARKLLFPGVLVLFWAGLIVLMSTSIGSWSTSQDLIQRGLNLIHPVWGHTPSSDTIRLLNLLLRKLAHFSEYAVLYSLAYWLTRRGFKVSKAIALPIVLAAVVLFAVSDEVHQSFVPGRTPQARDVLIDASGATAAACAALKFDRLST